MKVIAKTRKGSEFLYSTKELDIYVASDRSAVEMVRLMNGIKYRIKGDEVWHMYDYDQWNPKHELIDYKLTLYNGKLSAKRR